MATIMADQELDCTGLACPLPIIRTKKSGRCPDHRPGAQDDCHRSGLGPGRRGLDPADGACAAVGRNGKRQARLLYSQDAVARPEELAMVTQLAPEQGPPSHSHKSPNVWRSSPGTARSTRPIRPSSWPRRPPRWTWRSRSSSPSTGWRSSRKATPTTCKVPPIANPAMPVHIPNIVGMLPGMTPMATTMMNSWMHKAHVAKLSELLDMAMEVGRQADRLPDDDGCDGHQARGSDGRVEIGGAATFLEFASQNAITLTF